MGKTNTSGKSPRRPRFRNIYQQSCCSSKAIAGNDSFAGCKHPSASYALPKHLTAVYHPRHSRFKHQEYTCSSCCCIQHSLVLPSCSAQPPARSSHAPGVQRSPRRTVTLSWALLLLLNAHKAAPRGKTAPDIQRRRLALLPRASYLLADNSTVHELYGAPRSTQAKRGGVLSSSGRKHTQGQREGLILRNKSRSLQ